MVMGWQEAQALAVGGKFAANVEMLYFILRRKRLRFLPGGIARDIGQLRGVEIRAHAGVKSKCGAKHDRRPELMRRS